MTAADFLPLFTFQFMLVFARLGTAVFVFPAVSDPSINARFRLLMTVAIAFVMYPILSPKLPLLPPHTGAMLALLAGEMLIGLMMGLGARILMSIMGVAGELIAFMSGFQAATLFDPQSGASTAAPTIFLSLAAGLLMLLLNLHHALILAIISSYTAFPVGATLMAGDMLQAVLVVITKVFTVGLQIAAPVMVAGFLAYLMFGIFNRLIPQLQIFFLTVPLSISLSLVIMAASLTLMLEFFTTTMQENMFLLTLDADG